MDVEYAGWSARATTPAFEATLTITPPPVDRSRGTACRATRNGPLRLVSRHASQSASERSSTRPTTSMPALFTTMSSLPAGSSSANPSPTDRASATSIAMARTSSPRADSSVATRRPRVTSRAAT